MGRGRRGRKLPQKSARVHLFRVNRWARVRAFVKARAVAVYWQALTSHLYAPGQVGATRDAIAYQTDEALRGML